MGRAILRETGNFSPIVPDSTEYDNEIDEGLLEQRLRRLSKIVLTDRQRVCYVFGMGAHAAATYREMQARQGVEVQWHRSLFPWYLRFLDGIVASHEGLIKITQGESLPRVFSTLISMSMAGIYVFPHSFENDFLSTVRHAPPSAELDYGVKRFDDYLIYAVDADNYEAKTGMIEFVSYGKDASYVSHFL